MSSSSTLEEPDGPEGAARNNIRIKLQRVKKYFSNNRVVGALIKLKETVNTIKIYIKYCMIPEKAYEPPLECRTTSL